MNPLKEIDFKHLAFKPGVQRNTSKVLVTTINRSCESYFNTSEGLL